jgi:hypothetical protein
LVRKQERRHNRKGPGQDITPRTGPPGDLLLSSPTRPHCPLSFHFPAVCSSFESICYVRTLRI